MSVMSTFHIYSVLRIIIHPAPYSAWKLGAGFKYRQTGSASP